MKVFRDDNLTSEELKSGAFFGGSWLLEKHHNTLCTCSYCNKASKEPRNMRLWLPENRRWNSWRVMVVKKPTHTYYYRWTPCRWNHFLGFNFRKWGKDSWRFSIGDFGMKKNTVQAFLTLCSCSLYAPKKIEVESFLWRDLRHRGKTSSGVLGAESSTITTS